MSDFNLTTPTNEELDAFNADLQKLLSSHGMTMQPSLITLPNRLEAQMIVFKVAKKPEAETTNKILQELSVDEKANS